MAKQHHRSWLQVGAVSGQSLPKIFLIHDGSLRGVRLVRCCEAIEARVKSFVGSISKATLTFSAQISRITTKYIWRNYLNTDFLKKENTVTIFVHKLSIWHKYCWRTNILLSAGNKARCKHLSIITSFCRSNFWNSRFISSFLFSDSLNDLLRSAITSLSLKQTFNRWNTWETKNRWITTSYLMNGSEPSLLANFRL